MQFVPEGLAAFQNCRVWRGEESGTQVRTRNLACVFAYQHAHEQMVHLATNKGLLHNPPELLESRTIEYGPLGRNFREELVG